jgi:hypothetical protein
LDLSVSGVIPTPFRDEDIQEIFKILAGEVRLMPDCQHLCSEKFIHKCLEAFKQMSEDIALKKLKSGIKPGAEEKKPAQ